MTETRYVANTVVVHRPTGRVLLLTRAAGDSYRAGQPDLPGGKVNSGEAIHQGAARELSEEAGIHLTPEALTLVFAQTSYSDKGRHANINWLDLLFIAWVDDEAVALSEEHSAYQWVEQQSIAELLGHEPHVAGWQHIQKHDLITASAANTLAERRIYAGVKLLLENDKQEILVLRRSNTHPTMPHADDFPGGYVDFGELPDAAIVRELYEETGMAVQPGSLRLVFAATVADNGLVAHTAASATYLLYVAQAQDVLEPTLSYEHDAYWWRKTADLPASLANHNWQRAVTHVVTHKVIAVAGA